MQPTIATSSPSTRELASFLTSIRFDDLGEDVSERTKELFVDWIGSTLAGRTARPVSILERFAATMGPGSGPSEMLTSRQRTSPLFAAMINAAASHVVEQDDVHNASVFHPAAVVFPAVLAAAQQTGANGRDVIAASVAGYEAGVRVGAYLGRSHYRVFHTTGTAGTLAAATGVAHILGANEDTMLHALGSAGTQAAGLWEFLRDAADSKQLHCAKAASDGLLAAYTAIDGFTGATRILEGEQGMAAGMSSDPQLEKLTTGLGEQWAVLETSFKFHASCRHTHPAADALLEAIETHNIAVSDITHVRAHVHQAAIDVLGPVVDPNTVHQAKFSMGFVLSLIALFRRAGVSEFTDDALQDSAIRSFMERVEMVLDPEIDTAYPERWLGRVEIQLTNGQIIDSRVPVPKGDPDNTLRRDEIETKVRTLAAFQDGSTPDEIDRIMNRIWNLEQETDLRDLLPATP